MDRRRSERAQRREMIGRAVALVLREAVAGKPRVVLAHHPVARHLGDDRGGRDAEALAVAADDRGLRMLEARNPRPSTSTWPGARPSAGQRAQARLARRPIDIEPIDFERLGHADAPGERARGYALDTAPHASRA